MMSYTLNVCTKSTVTKYTVYHPIERQRVELNTERPQLVLFSWSSPSEVHRFLKLQDTVRGIRSTSVRGGGTT